MKNKRLKSEKGITLVALVLTIIILLILAAISYNAIAGDNGILSNAIKAKIKHEEEAVKEEIQLAWSARMSKYYEEAINGGTSSIVDFFSDPSTRDDLNSMLSSGAKINAIAYIQDDEEEYYKHFDITYINANNITYKITIKLSGEIVNMAIVEDAPHYTEVWANYYATEGKIIYTVSNDSDADKSWNITNPVSVYTSVPWYASGDKDNIIKIEISDDIVPEYTDFMFYGLEKVEDANIENLDKLLSKLKKIGYSMFSNCKKITSIELPEGIEIVDKHAFDVCTKLEKVVLPSTLTYIGRYAFDMCTSLNDISIPANVTTIGKNAFWGCYNLGSIEIPNGVTRIEADTFSNCGSLEIVIPSSVIYIDSRAFLLNANMTIRIKKEEGSIEGAPWGATSSTIDWEP